MPAKKKTAAKRPAKRAPAAAKTASRKPARTPPKKSAKAPVRGGEREVVYSDVLHELRTSLVSRLIR